ncbi:MAG: 4'-phosphopantetheinyl transferase family protein [Planctomycetota bacterium]|jgi:enterobactin synthetase component D
MNSADLDRLRAHLPDGALLEVAEVADHMADLHPEERALIAQAVAIRQREYSSARHLARGLLQRLVGESGPLLIREDRSPVWPEEVLGSLSHSREWCAVSVAHHRDGLLGIGVDIEDIRPMAAPLFAEILTPRELQDLPQDVAERTAQALSIFSIKESVYKCLQPIGNSGLGFQAMELDLSEDPTRPRLLPLQGLRSRLPAGCLPQVHLLRQNDTLLSLAILESP